MSIATHPLTEVTEAEAERVAPPADRPFDLPSAAAARYSVWLLTLIYMLNFVDRQIVNILAEPIKRDLGLADWQLGAMTGLGFAMFYTVLGIPMARLAERLHRGKIIAGCLIVWSGFTVACGLSTSFVQILMARIGVGVGEAGCTPSAQSLIADSVPANKRATALGTFSMGVPIGSLAGLVLGGIVAQSYGWRAAFMVAGAPGVLLALIAFATLRDPRPSGAAADRSNLMPLSAVLAQLRRQPAFWWLGAGSALTAFVGYGQQAFYVSFFLRNYTPELTAAAEQVGFAGPLAFVGVALGIVLGVSGGIGTLIGGRLGDYYAGKEPGGYAMVACLSMLIAGPLLAAVFFMGSGLAILGLLAVPLLFKNMWFGPVFAAIQGMIQQRSRSTATAIFLFVLNAGGLGLGALLTGAISDLFATRYGPAEGVRYALFATSLISFLSAACFWRAAVAMRRAA
ncbi:spinster family MFS transporter [Sphingomonas dokdonensis]|uniref:Hexuronate transporter n=1 Tax=Sphingomonas dokdonensis TaxID=344880 RepID=A0A245ZV64_9SPHN|nr:MFS transporter [Sphingomonas dokdonensis]OWK33610.1 hexuronate transporter [Sphingomonas dokdonensis]